MAQPNEPSTSCFKRCEYLVSSQDEQDGILSSATPAREKTPEPNWYIRFLSRYPAVVIVVVLVIVGTSGGVTLGTKDMPDFGDPLKGFSTRGTQIYKTTKTAIDVLDAYTLQPPIARVAITNGTGNGQRRKRSVGDVCSELNIKDGNAWTTKLVLESSTSGNLLTTASLRGICDFVDKLIKPNIPNFACPAVSVASRLAELRGKTCSQLDDDDVSYARNLLDECVQFYKSGKLKQNATATPEDRAVVSGSCYEADFVYNVMYYFADVGFYVKSHDLKYTIVYIHYPIHEQTNFSDVDKTFFQDHVEGKTIDNDIVKLVTVGFNNHEDTKYALFEGYLIRDLTYFGLAILLIGLFTLIYLLSFVLVVSTFINIVLSYCFAYFLYYNVCQMVFFPFINLMALLLLVAVGADDVFVFYDTWLQVKEEHPTWSVDQRMSNTFSHAIMSIFVTSFTTVAAFLANVVSDITAIQCFGIFAALAIAANFVMMVTIMPAIVVASDACSAHVTCPCNASTFGAFYRIPKKAYSWVMARLKSFFKTALPTVIRRAWWFCIAVGLALGLAALLIIFYKPALKPPTTKEFQLLSKDNALEKWDLDFKHRFPAEIAAVNKHEHIFVTIVFGFEATDPGNRLNPDDKTKALSRDSDFDMDRTNTRDWLSKLYDNIKNATFADSDFNYLSYLVSDEDMVRHVIKFACYTYRKYGVSNETAAFANMCCLGSVNATVVQSCMDQSRRHGLLRDATSKNIRGSSAGSPIYDTNSLPTDSSVLGFRLDVHTNLNYSVSYEEMRVSYEVLSNFMKTKLESAPEGLRSGFVGTNGYFEFYDLQHSLATGTLKSVALSIGVSFLVLLMTVRNVLITIYAMLTIVLSIACTVASIVLMGWKLNIVESMTITLAVGMSIDFTIHYGVVYQLSRETTSAERTRQSVERVGSAVAAAAWTTFSAGIAVLNCSVDPYRKLGIFLVLVMMFSWVYSTFFFLSLCHIIGPAGNFCQIPCPTTLARRTKNNSTVSDMDLGTIRNNVQ